MGSQEGRAAAFKGTANHPGGAGGAAAAQASQPRSLHAALLGAQQAARAGHDGAVPAEHVGVYRKAAAGQHVVQGGDAHAEGVGEGAQRLGVAARPPGAFVHYRHPRLYEHGVGLQAAQRGWRECGG